MNDGVKVNDAHVACPLVSQFWVYDPHTGASVWFATHCVPVDEGTGVVSAIMRKLEKEMYVCHKESPHPCTL